MASGKPLLGSRKDRWTSAEVHTLLATLNSRIEEISEGYQSDKKVGIESAASLLSEAVGNGCTPERITSKIKWLWQNAGPDGAGKLSEPIYLHGAWTRTLPYLNKFYAGMLESLSNAGKLEQRSKPALDDTMTHTYGLRRRKQDEDNDPYDCRCGYFHYASSSIHCSSCYTWQHIWCYYKTDDEIEPPDDHTCDKCVAHQGEALESDAILQQAMANLEIRTDTIRRQKAQPRSNSKRNASFDLSLSEDFYGFGAKELNTKAQSITSAIDIIAQSLNKEDFELCKASATNLNHQSDIYNIFEVLGLNAGDEVVFSAAEQTNLLKSVLAASIWQWTCYSSESTNSFGSPSNISEAMLYARTQISLEPCERKFLRTIHHNVWNSLAIDKPEILQPIITREAEELTRRLFRMLSDLIKCKKSTESEGFLRTVEDWIYHTPFGISRFKHIKQLFDNCIKFKNLFALSEYYYELHYPKFADMRFMDLDPADEGKEVLFCFTPAILEYEPDLSQRAEWGVSAVFGSQRFISTASEKRKEGRLISPAKVKFRQ